MLLKYYGFSSYLPWLECLEHPNHLLFINICYKFNIKDGGEGEWMAMSRTRRVGIARATEICQQLKNNNN